MSADNQKTEHELYLEKVRAEINHLLTQITRARIEADKMQAETAKANAETIKANVETDKMRVETAKANVEMEKVYKDLKWYEIVIIISATLAVVAIVKLFL